GGGKEDKEGGRPEGGVFAQLLTLINRRPFHTGGGCYLIEQDGGDHAGQVANQEGGAAGRQAGCRDGADQGWVEGEKGDQVACIARRPVAVRGKVEVMLRVAVIPGAAQVGGEIGTAPS